MKFSLNKGLKVKLIANFLVLSIIPALIISFFSYNNFNKSLEEAATNQLTVIRDSKKNEIEDYINNIKNKISLMSRKSITIDTMEEFKLGKVQENSEIFNKYDTEFRNFVTELEYGDVLLVDDKSGDVLYSALKESDYKSNLLTGTTKNTVVATAFKAVKDSSDKTLL
jgi:hypothetical protein